MIFTVVVANGFGSRTCEVEGQAGGADDGDDAALASAIMIRPEIGDALDVADSVHSDEIRKSARQRD